MKVVRLGDCCVKIGSGATPRGGSEVYLPTGISLIRSQNIYNDRFQRDGLAFIGEKHARELNNVTIEHGDILLNITGDSVARVNQVPDNILPARVNQHVAIIRPSADLLDARFVRYFLTSPEMQSFMLGLAASGGTRNALTKGMIEDFKVPCPSLNEQHDIAGVLGALDDKIELNWRMNETLEGIARALFQSWFVDFDPVRARTEGRQPFGMDAETAALFPETYIETSIGEIPSGWQHCEWGDIITLEYGKGLRNYASDKGLYPVYGTNGPIGTCETPLCDKPGIIIGRKGAYRGIHFSSRPFFVIDTAFYVKPTVEMSIRWAYYEMTRIDLDSMDSGSAIPSTSRSDFYRLPTLFPSVAIQKRWSELLAPLWQKQEQNISESKTLETLRDTLLPKLMSGEIHVRDAEKIVEATL